MLLRLAVLTAVMCVSTGCTSVASGRPTDPPNPPTSSMRASSRPAAPSTSRPPSSAARPSRQPRASSAASSRATDSSRAASSSPAAATTSAMRTSTSASPRTLLSGMSEAQRVGQLLMVDCPTTGVAAATATAIQTYHVGSVILDGTTYQGVTATKAVTTRLQGLAPASVKLLVSTDQEGGLVQRLRGSGFSTIPSALTQGTWYHGTLWSKAVTWAQQLHAAGVNVNLAPVVDTVPPGDTDNPPIGDLDREFGHYPTTVIPHGDAFVRGMAEGGVDATAKHFPGLGRVTGNTDTTSGVRDTITGPNDPYLEPFQSAVQAHVPFVMMSTAIYTRIDSAHPAAFSSTIVTGILRQRFGFAGVVISDDLGAAKQVSGYSVGSRAVDFIRAGGDLVLTVDAGQAGAMTAALLQAASASSSFRALVDASALRVLTAKSALGLLH